MSSPADISRKALRRRLIGRVLRTYLKPHLASLVGAVLSAAVVGALAAALSWMLEPTIRKLFLHPEPRALIVYPLALAGLGCCGGWRSWSRRC